jgi:ketosteroid isomerase-like protein
VQSFYLLILVAILLGSAQAQSAGPFASDTQPVIAAQRSFVAVAESEGIKSAFSKFLAPDSTIFRPGPVNGQQFWKASKDPSSLLLSRNITYADISSNGMLGYTTGNWRLYERGKSESYAKFGQYVTVWEKKLNGSWQATIDIGISHDKMPFSETDRIPHGAPSRDPNQLGWSPADASMKFTRLSMAPGALGGALEEFAADDVRFLRDGSPPIIGKKEVVKATRIYRTVRFPTNIALFQSADMAYTWNPCKFADSEEGIEEGNCLQIWKLDNKKWWIVLSVYARIPTEKPPVLKERDKSAAKPKH